MKRRSGLLRCAGALLVGLILVGCGSGNTPSSESTGGAANSPSTFVGLTRLSPKSIDPAVGADNPSWKVFAGVYEPLIDYALGTSDVEHLQGVLAKTWSVSDDGLVYTFHLRPNVKFHDGTSLDANDVKVSFDRMKSIGLGRSYLLDPVKEVDVVDDETVKVVLSQPYAPFLASLPLIYIVSSDAVKEHKSGDDLAQGWFAQHEDGTGPYKLTTFSPDDRIVMDKFSGYWGGWEGSHVTQVVLKIVPDGATQRVLMEGGKGDWADTISPGDLLAMDKEPQFYATKDATWVTTYALLNTTKAPLNNKLVRQALMYSFPYDQMVNDVLLGLGTVAHGFLPKSFAAYDGSLPGKTDLAKAKQLLQQAGYGDGELSLNLIYFNGQDWQRQGAELWAANLKTIGVSLKLTGSTWAPMASAMANPDQRPDIAILHTGPVTADPDSILPLMFSSASTVPYENYGFNNPQIDEQLHTAAITVDQKARVGLYQNIEAELNDLVPDIPLFATQANFVFRSNVKGYVYHPPYGDGPINYYHLWLSASE